ncbi:MAG: TRAP transporter large permease [Synergistetes bacterium]|nr:TRAP transporter large permease [Synergistota bacterium]
MGSTESGMVLLISLFFLLLLNGVPISFSLGVAAFITGYYLGLPLMVITQRLAAGINAFAFIAIPFFILAGKIMADGGIAERIVAFANVLVGRIRGGLAMVNIVASMLFGGISGSSVADVASIGPILIPMMEKQGYDKDFSVAVTITSSTEGIIIPPSHNMIIYSLAAGGVSVGQLFLAGYIPGIMIGVSLMIASYIIAVKKDYPRAPKYSFRQAVKITLDAILGLFVAIIIIGGIVSGIFTATEASVVAVVYAMFIGFFAYRTLTLRMFGGILVDAVKMVSMVMFLIASASVFGYLLAYMQVPALVTNILLSLSHSKYVLLILINIMVLFLGMIMDFAPLVVILTPILLPVVMKLGMTPVQFGIVLMINLAIGLCTPPVGNTLFVGCSVGNTTIERATKASLPFYTAMVAILMLVTFIPQITMLIPSLFYK